MTEEEKRLFRQLTWAYRQIGIPVIKETLDIFLECSDKQGMVDKASEWANSMRY